MTTPGFIGATGGTATGGPVTVSKPAGVGGGDLLLAAVTTVAGSEVDSAPDGWTLLAGYPLVATNDRLRQYVYEKSAGAAEPDDYTWTQTDNSRIAVVLAAYPIAVLTGAVANQAGAASGTARQPPVPTGSLTAEPDTRWVTFLSADSGVSISNLAVHPAQTRRMLQLQEPLGVAVGDDAPGDDGDRDGQAFGVSNVGWGLAGTLLAIQHGSLPPHAPELDQVATFDATTPQTLTYTFADPNIGDTQSARQIEIVNTDGTAAVDTGKVATSSETYDLAADTLTNEERWQWRVKTWDLDDNEGSWSDWATFRTSTPPTVQITTPADDAVVESPSMTVEWDYTHPERSQSWRQVEVMDAGTVIYDTGKEATGQHSHLVTGLATGKAYTVRVTVWSTLDQSSDPDDVAVTTNFSQPPQPTVTSELVEGNRLRVRIQNPPPGAGEVEPDANDLYRRVAATAFSPAGPWVRIAAGVGLQGMVDDWQVAHDVEVEYQAVALWWLGDAHSPVHAAVLDLVGTWLHDVADPAGSATRVRGANQRDHRWAADHALTRYHGRRRPVAEWGQGGEESVTVTVTMPDDAAAVVHLVELLRARATLCYRDSSGRLMFVASPEVTTDDHLIGGSDVTVTLHAVDYDEEV